MTLFLLGIARRHTSKLVDLAEHEKEAKRSETPIIDIRPPTKDDYKFILLNMSRAGLYSVGTNSERSQLV